MLERTSASENRRESSATAATAVARGCGQCSFRRRRADHIKLERVHRPAERDLVARVADLTARLARLEQAGER